MYSSLLIGFITSVCALFLTNTFWLLGTILSSTYAITVGFSSYFNTVQLILRERMVNAVLSVSGKVIGFIVPFLLIHNWENTSITVLIGYIIGAIMLLILQIFFYGKSKEKNTKLKDSKENVQYIDQLVKFAMPFVTWGVFQSFQFVAERWSLNLFCSIEDVGYYTVLSQIGFQTPAIGYGIVATILTPILFEKTGASTKDLIIQTIKFNNKIIFFLAIISLLFLPVIYNFSEEILVFLVDKKFVPHAYLLPVFFASSIFFNVGQLISSNFTINLMPSKLILPKISCMILTIVLSLWSSKIVGLKGVAGAVCVTSFVYFIWMIIITKLYMNKLEI